MLSEPQGTLATRQVGFLLLPGFSLLSQACALEPLLIANQLASAPLYNPVLFRSDATASHCVSSASATSFLPVQHIENTEPQCLDMLMVCGASATQVMDLPKPSLIVWLEGLAKQGVMLGAIAGGSHVLARAGALNGYRAAIHWKNAESFQRDFPEVRVSHQLFEIDRDRFTCGGGTAAIDLMMTLIGHHHGRTFAERVSEYLVCERIRLADEPQHVPVRSRLGHAPQALVEAVTLMESNVEEPLGTNELAAHLGLSRRQLERLFKKYLHAVPSRYYLDLRLQCARKLLRETDHVIGDIALQTGFSSAAHFSTAYRQHFGQSPRDERLL
ncbi:GlxA family transcriptional regulator [Phytohalomonas tamaricis]|uniref:GlxA family transcriptional regulator n=1 Tax=Phytohalomonas tamaricis TaxID=2081032 RepID=UPI0021D41504|nr:GlxA family transcriptional regulator [Phytohalomonas tamaricis]